MKLILTLMFICNLSVCIAQQKTINLRIARDSAELAQLKNEFTLLKTSVEQNNTLVANGHSVIANELSTATTSLGIFTIILTIMLVIAGILFTRMESSTRKIGAETSQKLLEIKAIESSISKIQSEITGNLSQLYKDLQHEEINEILALIDIDHGQIASYINKLNNHMYTPAQIQKLQRILDDISSDPNLVDSVRNLKEIIFTKSPETIMSSPIYHDYYALLHGLPHTEKVADVIIKNINNPKFPTIRKHLKQIVVNQFPIKQEDELIALLTPEETKELLGNEADAVLRVDIQEKLKAKLI